MEFQPFLTEIARQVYAVLSCWQVAKFGAITQPQVSKAVFRCTARLLTDGNLEGGGAGEGLMTTLHYADGLTNAKDVAFRTVRDQLQDAA